MSLAERTLLASLNDKRPEVATAVARVLGEMDSRTAQSALLDKGADGQTPEEVRVAAFKGIATNAKYYGNRLDAGHVDTLRKVVQAEPSQPVKNAAAEAMGALNLPVEQIKALILDRPQQTGGAAAPAAPATGPAAAPAAPATPEAPAAPGPAAPSPARRRKPPPPRRRPPRPPHRRRDSDGWGEIEKARGPVTRHRPTAFSDIEFSHTAPGEAVRFASDRVPWAGDSLPVQTRSSRAACRQPMAPKAGPALVPRESDGSPRTCIRSPSHPSLP